MNFAGAVGSGFRNYFNFKGRASRREFWFWILFTLLLSFALAIVEASIWPAAAPSADWMRDFESALAQPTPLTSLASLILFLPGLSILARRLHDAGFTAKWLLIQLVPVGYGLFATVGAVAVISNIPAGQPLMTEDLMSLIFLVIPIFALGLATLTVLLVLALKPSRSFYDGNRYVEPEPLSPMDEGTTA